MSDARDEKLDALLRSRLMERIDPDFVPRIVAKSKALEQIEKTPAFDAGKQLQHLRKSSTSRNPCRKSF
jgi:hypothetical protein